MRAASPPALSLRQSRDGRGPDGTASQPAARVRGRQQCRQLHQGSRASERDASRSQPPDLHAGKHFLNVRLFNRGREGNTLTAAGEEYHREIAPAFEAISVATDRIRRGQDKTPLNVRVPSTFATRFLIPRLSQFRAEEPGIGVRIVTGYGAVDFAREEGDISIQPVSGGGPGS